MINSSPDERSRPKPLQINTHEDERPNQSRLDVVKSRSKERQRSRPLPLSMETNANTQDLHAQLEKEKSMHKVGPRNDSPLRSLNSLTTPDKPSLLRAESTSKLLNRSPGSSSRLLRSSSASFRASTNKENNDVEESKSSEQQQLSSTNDDTINSHLQLQSYRPKSLKSIPQSTSFFLMVTGHIESASSHSSTCLNDKLYCRYSYSYGSEDWKVVHGVSHGHSQIATQGVVSTNDEEGGNVIVWNFPIEISFQSSNPQGWPRLALSIYGLDFAGRDVLRGYASMLIPMSPGRHTKYLKTYRPVSGSKLVQFVNWLFGTNPGKCDVLCCPPSFNNQLTQSPILLEYYDSKMVTRGDGRSVTRVISSDRTIKINLMVTMKDFATFGYVSSSPK